MPQAAPARLQATPLALPLLLGAAKLLLHLSLSGRYGHHRDELYFIECGKHLAFGYVDHAPLVPWLARLAGALFGGYSLFAVRFFPALAGALAVFLTVQLVRELGGGRYAQLIAGLAMLGAPAYLRMSGLLCLPAFEVVFWTLAAYLIVLLMRKPTPIRWLLLGAVVGLGLLNKHTMLLWGLGCAAGLIFTDARRHLRQPWVWLAGGLALLMFMPNVLWQQRNDWATLEFITRINRDQLDHIPRVLFLLGQFLYMGPAAVLIWGAGLIFFFSALGRDVRVLGWIFVVALSVLLIKHGKPYYLAAAYPPLFAGGAVLLEQKLASRVLARRGLAAILVLSGGFFGLFSLPILPLPVTDAVLERLLGSIVRPVDLTGEFHDQYGWPEQAAQVAQVYHQLPVDEQKRAGVLAQNYGQAGAVNFFAASQEVPRATSGHMTHYLWGPPEKSDVVIAIGMTQQALQELWEEVTKVAEHSHPLALSFAKDVKTYIYVCRKPKQSLRDAWPTLKRYYFAMPPSEPRVRAASQADR